MKLKTIYICQQCGQEESKWTGKCPACEAWNSFIEDVIDIKAQRQHTQIKASKPEKLTESHQKAKTIKTNLHELDQVLGGGIVPGSLILISGEPGIGKSTLTIQICSQIAEQGIKTLYISGEESTHQIASRAKRLKITSENINLINASNLENIISTIEAEKPQFLIIDSIQVISSQQSPSLAGSISQVRYCAEKLMEIAKQKQIPTIIIGHVTKDGNIAGPRLLEHLVDTVLYLEGERYQNFRLLRGIKNRYGSTNELGIFEMSEQGLTEVQNPSKIFLKGRKEDAIGSVITATLEGNRPFLIEVQALASRTAFGYPKRAAQGFDLQRTQLLLAVLQKYAKMNFLEQDVYVNIAGGFKLKDPACDLAILMAIASSFSKKSLPNDTLILGEVGLSGEIRPITQLARRLKEAEKLGLKKALIPFSEDKITSTLDITEIRDIKDALLKYEKNLA